MNRIDNWIESRLMNAKKNQRTVSTKDLIAEIGLTFKLNTSPHSIRNLQEKIKTIRNRVNKKCANRKQTYERYARKLFVPNEMIQRWVENGLFPIQNPQEIERLTRIIEERDYFREALRHEKEDYTIPIDKGTLLIGYQKPRVLDLCNNFCVNAFIMRIFVYAIGTVSSSFNSMLDTHFPSTVHRLRK